MAHALGTTIDPTGITGDLTAPPPADHQSIQNNPSSLVASTATETIDQLLYRNWIYHDVYTIDTSMVAGHVFGIITVHPDNCNQFIKYTSRMFNAWNGTMHIRARFMATAFYGGSIRVGFVPPNMTPQQIRSMSVRTLTAYPNQDFDPKNTMWNQYSPPDERNVLFHWLKPFDNIDIDDMTSYIGGHIIFYVVGPLVTQSADYHSISMVVETCGNFNFAQPNPTFGLGDTAVYFGPLNESSTQNINFQIGCDSNNRIDSIQILASTTANIAAGGLYSCGVGGKEPPTWPNYVISAADRTYKIGPGISRNEVGQCNIILPTDTTIQLKGEFYNLPNNMERTGVIKCTSQVKNAAGVVSDIAFTLHYEDGTAATIGVATRVVSDTVMTPTATYFLYGTDSSTNTPVSVGLLGVLDNPTHYAPQASGESIVTFTSVEQRTMDVQTIFMAEALKKSHMSSDPNRSWLYSIRSDDTEIPLIIIRLNPCGMFTTAAKPTDVLLYTERRLRLQYEGELPLTSPLPSPSSEARAYQRRLMKATSRTRQMKDPQKRLETLEEAFLDY